MCYQASFDAVVTRHKHRVSCDRQSAAQSAYLA